jgi:hypothetical protein
MKSSTTTAQAIALLAAAGLALTGCGKPGAGDDHAHGPDTHEHAPAPAPETVSNDTHTHADGSTHGGHEPDLTPQPAAPSGDAHTDADGSTHGAHSEPTGDQVGHGEAPLAPATIGGMAIQLTQGHGGVGAGKESHLIVRLPYSDNGATIVRAWIGTNDRTLSYIGKGEYAPSHGGYDIHAAAPDPMPENAMWWIEIERPDGTKVVGSAEPIME